MSSFLVSPRTGTMWLVLQLKSTTGSARDARFVNSNYI